MSQRVHHDKTRQSIPDVEMVRPGAKILHDMYITVGKLARSLSRVGESCRPCAVTSGVWIPEQWILLQGGPPAAIQV